MAPADFWRRVEKGPGCWEWRGPRDARGYGVTGHDIRAHRAAYELTKGPIPIGLVLCHRCDNPGCCNPAHAFVSTPAGNVYDMVSKGRNRARNGATSRHVSRATRRSDRWFRNRETARAAVRVRALKAVFLALVVSLEPHAKQRPSKH
jgi:hypothetical protein